MDRPMISPIFAHLPNGIIREIVAYTGASYKKRNGKYMGQIPRTDPRYALLSAIPQKTSWFHARPDFSPNCVFYSSSVFLSRITDTCPIRVRLEVFGSKYTNDRYCGNQESIRYELQITRRHGLRVGVLLQERPGQRLSETISEFEIRRKKTRKIRNLLQHVVISIVMFVTGVIYALSITREIASIRYPHLA
jgi:hypothetical protein